MTSAYNRRMTEYVAYCPYHIGIGFAGYHVGYQDVVTDANQPPERVRVFECSLCSRTFLEFEGIETDPR